MFCLYKHIKTKLVINGAYRVHVVIMKVHLLEFNHLKFIIFYINT